MTTGISGQIVNGVPQPIKREEVILYQHQPIQQPSRRGCVKPNISRSLTCQPLMVPEMSLFIHSYNKEVSGTFWASDEELGIIGK